MRRLEFLIQQARRASENEDVNVVTGISTEEFVQYFNDAQERIQSLIHQEHPETDIFAKEGFINVVARQEVYPLATMLDSSSNSFNSHIYAKNTIASVEISGGSNYTPLKMISNKERRTGWGYIIRDDDLLLAPIPGGADVLGLRIVFMQRLPRVDIRRGEITNVVGQAITLGSVPSGTAFTDEADYVSIVDDDGVVVVEGVKIDSWSAPTLTIATGEDITAASNGNHVVYGKWATTHSQLPEECEKYLLAYCERKIYMRDSSTDVSPQNIFTKEMEEEIVGLFADNTADAAYPPIAATDYMIW